MGGGASLGLFAFELPAPQKIQKERRPYQRHDDADGDLERREHGAGNSICYHHQEHAGKG